MNLSASNWYLKFFENQSDSPKKQNLTLKLTDKLLSIFIEKLKLLQDFTFIDVPT